VMEGDGAGVAFGDRILQRIIGAEEEHGGNAQPGRGADQTQGNRMPTRRTQPHCMIP
jgi:hypothetical protein